MILFKVSFLDEFPLKVEKNDGLRKTTIPFTVKGGKIIDGEFHTGSDGTTSSEVCSFTGAKVGKYFVC